MEVLSILLNCGESNGHDSFRRKRHSEARSACCAVHLQRCHVERHLRAMGPGHTMLLDSAGETRGRWGGGRFSVYSPAGDNRPLCTGTIQIPSSSPSISKLLLASSVMVSPNLASTYRGSSLSWPLTITVGGWLHGAAGSFKVHLCKQTTFRRSARLQRRFGVRLTASSRQSPAELLLSIAKS